MMRSFVRARQGVITRVFPHNANRRFVKGSRDVAFTPGTLSPAAGALPDATVAVPYNQPVSVVGGEPPYQIIVAGGALPPGLALGAGAIAGTPTTAGAYAFTLRAFNYAQSLQNDYTLTVLP